MQKVLRHEAIHSFLRNFKNQDQFQILQDIILIGIETVLKSLSCVSQTKFEKKYKIKDLGNQLKYLQRDVENIKNRIEDDLKDSMDLRSNNKIQIQKQETNKKKQQKKRNKIQQQVTPKVTQTYPKITLQQNKLSPKQTKKNSNKINNHSQIIDKKPIGVSKKTKKNNTKPAHQYNTIDQNISQQGRDKLKNSQSYRQTEKSPNKHPISSQLSSGKKTITNSLPFSLKQVDSKIKDILDFDKRNAKNSSFRRIIQQERERQSKNQDNLITFKNKTNRMNSNSDSQQIQDSLVSQQFSPYKKQQKSNKQIVRQFKNDIFQPNILNQHRRIKYPYKTIQHPQKTKQNKTHRIQSNSSSSSQISSQYSPPHQNKNFGKISRHK